MKLKAYGLNPVQFLLLVVRPALQRLELWSPAAEQLVLGTALYESNLEALLQIPDGPARGPFQTEPATHLDAWLRFLPGFPKLREALRLMASWSRDEVVPSPAELSTNLLYAAAVCRICYYRARPALPLEGDAQAMAEYYKRWYNTPAGKGTVAAALPHMQTAIELSRAHGP